MSYKRYFTLFIAAALLSLFSFNCGSSEAQNDKDEKSTAADSSALASDDSTTKKENKDEELIPVEVTTIERGAISSYILLSSNLETEQMADVYSRIQGIVTGILVDEGSHVRKGQVLMELDAEEYRLAEERARLNYEQQQSEFERMKAMYEQDLLSIEEFEKARFTVEGLRVDWEQAKLNLSYTKITSPIEGVIGNRLRKPGDRIQQTDNLFTVINTSEMIAVVYAPEKEMGSIATGQAAYISSDHLQGQRYTGWVKRVSPVVDAQSGTFKVTVGVRNENDRLRAGMFVNTHIITATHDDAVLIPKMAVVYENEYMNVFVVRDSVAHKVTLDAGFQDHEKVESLNGIEAGDKVIVVGQAGLKDKTRVKVVSERENHVAARNRNDFLALRH
jgi:membrane fusion protein (multidrug efflux system)